jgi:hypothetical protein
MIKSFVAWANLKENLKNVEYTELDIYYSQDDAKKLKLTIELKLQPI